MTEDKKDIISSVIGEDSPFNLGGKVIAVLLLSPFLIGGMILDFLFLKKQ